MAGQGVLKQIPKKNTQRPQFFTYEMRAMPGRLSDFMRTFFPSHVSKILPKVINDLDAIKSTHLGLPSWRSR